MGPTTRVDDAPTNQWAERPGIVRAIRFGAFAGPLLCSFAFVTAVGRAFPRPAGFWPSAGWWTLMVASSTGVLLWSERLFRRFAPMAALYKMSLVFPDQAPSRFKVAMRTNTLRQLERSIDAEDFAQHSTTAQAAAEELVSMAGALNAHDRLTRGHTERVRAYTYMIGEELDLPANDLQLLHWAGLVHDIGKIRVPPEILNKPGKPTEDEWKILGAHPAHGEELVAPLRPWLGMWADAASQHHERWDGNGYPNKLRGEQISLAGRIVAVADAYDVMTSVRSYKKAMSAEEARAELARCAGSQFDPRVVRAFLNLSVGRLRMVMGPLSWLTNVPVLGNLPGAAGSALATTGAAATVAAVTVGAVLSSGLAAPPDTTASAANPGALVVATPLSLSGDEDGVVTIDRERVPGSPTALAVTTVPEGFAVEDAGTRLRLVPRADWNGSSIGRYRACWGESCSDADLRVELSAVNDPPLAEGDTVDAVEDQQFAIRPLENDVDVDGDPLRLTAVADSATVAGADGTTRTVTLAVSIDGQSATVTTPSDTVGTMKIGYVVTDPAGSVSTGTVLTTIAAVNDQPAAADDAARVASGTTATINVLTNDTDVDGDVLSVRGVTALSGPGSFSTDGTHVLYTSPAEASGTATARYVTTDPAGAVSSASVTVEVIDDASPPAAYADAARLFEDADPIAIDVLANDADPDGPPAGRSVRVVSRPLLGAAMVVDSLVRYAPKPNATGTDVFDVEQCDATSLCSTATLTVTIDPVNDPPRLDLPAAVVVDEDSGPHEMVGWARGVSPGGGPDEATQGVSVTVAADRPEMFASGPTIAPSGALLFTPAPDASGTAVLFVHAIDDGGVANGGSNTAPAIPVALAIGEVNDAPVAVADVGVVDEDDVDGVAINLAADDVDIDADALTVLSVGSPSGFVGSIHSIGSTTVTFVPASDFSGTATFTYVVSDGRGGSAAGTVDVAVVPLDDPPVATTDRYSTLPDAPLTIGAAGLLANDLDPDGDTLTVSPSPASAPAHGAVLLGPDGSFSYTPDSGYSGLDTFGYQVTDTTGRTDTSTVSVTVDDGTITRTLYLVNDQGSTMSTSPPPVDEPEPDSGNNGEPGVSIWASTGDEIWILPGFESTWDYTVPAGGLHLDGNAGLELWSTIDSFATTLPAEPVARLYDCDPTGLSCTRFAEQSERFSPYNGSTAGWVSRSLEFGGVTRTIAAGRKLRLRLWVKENEIWVAASGNRPSALKFTLANTAPVANPDPEIAIEDGMVITDVIGNDVDSNLDPASVTVTSPPSQGTATPTADGRIAYVPSADANGSDAYTYEVCDTQGLCATAVVSVTITEVNDAPSFLAGGDITAHRSTPWGSAPNWASAISTGPSNESTQTRWFAVSVSDPTLFAAGPAISPDGTLTWTLAVANNNGSSANITVSVTVVLHDSGGTTDGGIDTSPPQVFTLRIRT